MNLLTGFNTFNKSISPKVNVIMRVDFELACFEMTIQLFTHTLLPLPCFYHFLSFSFQFVVTVSEDYRSSDTGKYTQPSRNTTP